MKKYIITMVLMLASIIYSCKKNEADSPQKQNENLKQVLSKNLSLAEAKAWVKQQDSKQPEAKAWQKAACRTTPKGTSWIVELPGQPQAAGIKGYTQLLIHKDKTTNQISAKILDYLPDGVYLQQHPKAKADGFTGRIYEKDLKGKLIRGMLVAEGKPIGEISPDTSLSRVARSQYPLLTVSPTKTSGRSQAKLSTIHLIETTYWVDSYYIDSDGVFTIHSERVTNYFYYDDGIDDYPGTYYYLPDGYVWEVPSGGGYGGGSYTYEPPTPPAPELSNLPGEDKPKTNPKELTKCFDNIPSAGASVNITVYIQEPWPETTFNVGPNSVGHVAIGITKTNGSQSITQILGFYPDATGTGRYSAPSKIADNGGDLEYNVSASYTITTDQLAKILTAINNPSPNYHAMNYNCTNFVYSTLRAGDITLPDPTVEVGIPTPGSVTSAMTPAGLSQAYRIMKYNQPNSKITTDTQYTPNSKGPCHD